MAALVVCAGAADPLLRPPAAHAPAVGREGLLT